MAWLAKASHCHAFPETLTKANLMFTLYVNGNFAGRYRTKREAMLAALNRYDIEDGYTIYDTGGKPVASSSDIN